MKIYLKGYATQEELDCAVTGYFVTFSVERRVTVHVIKFTGQPAESVPGQLASIKR